MDGNDLPVIGFDERAFWGEANMALAKGTREMLLSTRDKKGLVDAYDRMDYSLGELIEKMDPPEGIRQQLYDKLEHRISILSSLLKNRGVDVGESWESDMKKVAVIVLQAFGKTQDVVSIPRLVDDASALLCNGNFTDQGAKIFMAEMSTYDCKGLRSLLKQLQDTPSHMDFLRLLEKEGVPKARKAAKETMAKMLPQDVMAVTIKAPAAMGKLLHMPSIRRPQAPQPARRA